MQRLVLEMPAEFRHHAGQYLEVVHPEGVIPLSIASGPRRLPELRLHYRSTPGAREAAWMDELLEAGAPLQVRGPCGDAILPQSADTPLLLAAGGTGAAQLCAILDEIGPEDRRAPVSVLWCADSAAELYCREELETLRAAWLHVEFIVDPRRDRDNTGLLRLRELACSALTSSARAPGAPDGVPPWVLLAGSPGFVYAAFDTIRDAGIDPALIHSDVFAYAPRPAPATGS